ncbi:hypothetical protein LCGC14_0877930 [marine sediment metagenome]|uniref:Uncharacterized protein n=1 Tax=marine sediment metagenome TaxID=412755 RepID=A0A0F9RMD7_9ZZZZ
MAIRDAKMDRGSKGVRHEFFPPMPDGPITPVVLSINGTAEQFDVAAFLYVLDNEILYHAASTGHTLSAIHATGIGAWLGCAVFVDRQGTISTLGNPDTGDQDHASEAAAFTSLDAMIDAPPTGKAAIGTITLLTNAADWDGNTDAFDEADLVAANLLGFFGDRRLGAYKPGWPYQVTALRTDCKKMSGVKHLEVLAPDAGYTGILTQCRIEPDIRTVAAVPVKLRFGEFDYAIAGVVYHKNASKLVAFTAAHVVSLDKWGAVLFQINAAGTISTKVVATPQAYANEAAARAALPSPDASNVAIATLIVEADAGTWTANTDDIKTAGDLEAFDLLPVTHDRLLSAPGLVIDPAEAEDFRIGTFTYVIDGVKYSKTTADGNDFTAAHVCALDKWLAILVEINAAGTPATKVPLVSGRSQTASQGFDTATAAIAALPPVTPGKVAVGYILIEADGSTWTANTDDMTAAGDVDNATFVNYTVPTNEIFAAQTALFAAETPTDATLATLYDPRRGADQMVVLLGGTTGTVKAPQVTVEYRPWPLSGDVS